MCTEEEKDDPGSQGQMLSSDASKGPGRTKALCSASPGLLPTRTPQEPERHPGVWPESASASQPLCAMRLH